MKIHTINNDEQKIENLANELKELWELLTASERKRKTVFCQFLELQKQVQDIQQQNQFLKRKIENEQAIR